MQTNTDQQTKEIIYIDYLNKDNNFKPSRKFFDIYEQAKEWCIKNLQSFNADMIHYTNIFTN